MLPLVIDSLRDDLIMFGRCNYAVTDDYDAFVIERLDPRLEVYTLELY